MELSKTEKMVYIQALTGQSNLEIATTLQMKVKTVKYHLTSIYKKLDVRSRAQLIARQAVQVPVQPVEGATAPAQETDFSLDN